MVNFVIVVTVLMAFFLWRLYQNLKVGVSTNEQLKQRLFTLAIYQIGYEDGQAKLSKRLWNLREVAKDENEFLNLKNFYKKGYDDALSGKLNSSERSIWYVSSKNALSEDELHKFDELFMATKQMFLSLDKS